jgi:3-deoxy-D-manno-octulosonic-acid transferase
MLWRILLSLLSLMMLPLLVWHPRLRCRLSERLGLFSNLAPKKKGRRIWLHGASGGDLVTLVPLAKSLKALSPDIEIIATALTRSGQEVGHRYTDVFDHVFGQPVDGLMSPSRAMRRIKPDALILEYAEIWPGLIHAAKRQGALIVLNNGRIAPENVIKYRYLSLLCGHVLDKIDLYLMRNEDEAKCARATGAAAEKVFVTGNTKFDALRGPADPERVARMRTSLNIPQDVLVWSCGSTHEGEEQQLLDVFKKLRQVVPELRLILAPRYTERGGRLYDLAVEMGFHVWMRSRGPVAVEHHIDVYVMDTMGELQEVYGLSTIVFVGGSLVPRGGQNILEPAAESKAVLFGPMMATQKDLVDALVGRGGIQVQDHAHLYKVMKGLLENDAERLSLGEMAAKQVAQIRGASERNATHIMDRLDALSRSAS